MPIAHPHVLQPQQPPLSEKGPLLDIQRLSFTYPDGQTALQAVSLILQPGEKVALVGPNGAGKSTLLLHVNGLLNGTGRVEVAGLDVKEENFPILRARVGLVFQNPDDQLFSPTVYEDVAFGPLHMGLPEAEIHARVRRALAQVGMEEYGPRLSYHLSVGEKKRIAIATVLSMQPELLVLDEPSSGLDPRARRQLIDLLAQLPLGMLVATHDLLLVRDLLPRMVILDEGRVVADGQTNDLLSNERLLAAHGLELP